MKRYMALLIGALLLTGCPQPPPREAATTSTTPAAVAPAGPVARVTLVRTDLGLGDGAFVREADAALAALAKAGRIDYAPVGELPLPLINEADAVDVGLPVAGSTEPGTMTLTAGCELINGVADAGWLVLTSPFLLDHALARIAAGHLTADLILVLDDDGLVDGVPPDPPVPVYAVSYDIRPVAFLAGVAAAVSSNNGMFVIMAADSDPHADEFLDAVWAGAKYHTNGAVAAVTHVPVDAGTGLVTPESYLDALDRVKASMSSSFASNHYILALGRTTPAIMNAVSKTPVNGYLASGYADYRSVRPSRVVGCALKQPGAVITYIFAELPEAGLAGLADAAGLIQVGLDQQAVGFTGFELYDRTNFDATDIAEAVGSIQGEIEAGELDVNELIETFNRED